MNGKQLLAMNSCTNLSPLIKQGVCVKLNAVSVKNTRKLFSLFE